MIANAKASALPLLAGCALLLWAAASALAATPYIGPSIPDRDGQTIWNIFSDNQTLSLQTLPGSSADTNFMFAGSGLRDTLVVQNLGPTRQASIYFDTDGTDWSLGVGGTLNAFMGDNYYILKIGLGFCFSIDHTTGVVAAPFGLSAGGGTPLKKIISAAFTVDFPSTAPGGVATQDVTLTGVSPGDQILVAPSAWYGPIGVFCTSANTVTVEYDNSRSTTQDPLARSFTITVLKF